MDKNENKFSKESSMTIEKKGKLIFRRELNKHGHRGQNHEKKTFLKGSLFIKNVKPKKRQNRK
jgi:hypothetical protein